MTRIVSEQTKIEQISGLADSDLSDWERDFIASIVERAAEAKAAKRPINLTERQSNVVNRLWERHFA